jgi:tetratricopeptide (TPR) repeat protein
MLLIRTKMKILLPALALACAISSVDAQTKDKAAIPTQETARVAADPEVDIYNRALRYGDYAAAKSAVYSLLQKHPENKGYLDSLARIYFTLGAYGQCILVASDFLQGADSDNVTMMEMVAISQSSLNRYKESLEMWDRLWKKTGSDQYAYQVAVNQYMLKRYGECGQTIDIILKDPAADKETVSLSAGEGQSQKVPMKAAAHNLMGVLYKDLGKTEDARKSFEAALKISPEFELAKNNLTSLDKKEEQKDGKKK